MRHLPATLSAEEASFRTAKGVFEIVRGEEAAGSNPATPTQVRGSFLVVKGEPLFVRAWLPKAKAGHDVNDLDLRAEPDPVPVEAVNLAGPQADLHSQFGQRPPRWPG
jgi:hypothetical protein